MFNFFFVLAPYNPQHYIDRGYNFLNSWHDNMRILSRNSKLLEAGTKNSMGFLDSGAYSNATQKKKTNLDALIDYINSDENKYTICCQVDTLPLVRDTQYSAEKTYENFVYMLERVNKPEKLGVCFHVGEDYSYLKKYLDTRIDGKKAGYLCLGGCVGKHRKIVLDFFSHCFDAIEESSQPDIKVHAFGVFIRDILEAYPFFSSDSSTHLRLSSHGRILIPSNDSRLEPVWIGDFSVGGYGSYHALTVREKDIVNNELKEFGYTLEQIIEDYKARSHYNADAIMKYFSTYKCKYKKIKNKKFF